MSMTGRYHPIQKAPMPTNPNDKAVGQPFETALTWLKSGRKITRSGWNGKGMYCYHVAAHESEITQFDPTTRALVDMWGEGKIIELASRIDMRYASGFYGVWTPTIEDILANDWRILT